MYYTVRRRATGCYSAHNLHTGRYFSRCTDKPKASRQAKRLRQWLRGRLYGTQRNTRKK